MIWAWISRAFGRGAARRRATVLAIATVLLLGAGCQTSKTAAPGTRPFQFPDDAFSYANELKWVYHFDEAGHWRASPREPKPKYWLHCVVVARSAAQFFRFAKFDPSLPRVGDDEYARLVRRVTGRDPSRAMAENGRVVIPGYKNLREFSAEKEGLLKRECGGAWRSYVQRGGARMIFPFFRGEQERVCRQTVEKVRGNRPVILHLTDFPSLAINHAVLAYAAIETASGVRFDIYDPNYPEKPGVLEFDRARRSFVLPGNTYFIGGPLNAYPIYETWYR